MKPNEQSSDDDKLAYLKWRKTYEMGRCYIMTSISNVLQHNQLSAFEILENFKQMFGDQVDQLSRL
ncbi:hypothetical protein R3W88_011557 [Solanum pinnatisectum]|uniref:Uncharacterized protein n=1 Tax=Solanum pinnatisectum TaxID=50273 RepID=A0AAV9L947_9SOLN|nr:hypothetical protein R3W88_011557 [Solanum pinnatisectum]